TALALRPDTPTRVTLIQGVARIPPDFIGVRAIEPRGANAIRIIGEGGASVDVAVDLSFVRRGILKDLIQ
ncbi:MAG: hypothetical protein M1457_00860, partial [bacterium]|nr:hypothetical protein [bacterium]